MSPYVSHDQCDVCVLTLLDGQLHGHPCAVCHGVVDSTDVSVCVCLSVNSMVKKCTDSTQTWEYIDSVAT